MILKLCDGPLESILGSLMEDRSLRICVAVLLRVCSSMIILGSARKDIRILLLEGALVVEACGTILLNVLVSNELWHRFTGSVRIWVCHHSGILIRILLQILVLRVLCHLTLIMLTKWVVMHRGLSSLGGLRLMADMTWVLHLNFRFLNLSRKI